jgi:tetratricopeptide (TPR) repeat protein
LPTQAEAALLGPDVLARVYSLRAARAIHVGDAGASVENLEAAIACFDTAGQNRMACMVRSNLGSVYCDLGEIERAEQVLRQVLVSAGRLGASRVEAYAHINLAGAMAEAGRTREARESGTLAATLAKSHEDRRAEGAARTILSRLAFDEGNVELALQEAETAIAVLAGQEILMPRALARCAEIHLRCGRIEDARAKIEAAMAIIEAHGGVESAEAAARLVHFRVLTALGEHARAREAIVAARERLLARAQRIKSEALRESFLTRVPDNAATLRLAAEVG